jgi:hypothetical protein
MTNDPIADELERVLNYGGPERVWPVPENATFTVTGDTSTHMLDGAVITFWTED